MKLHFNKYINVISYTIFALLLIMLLNSCRDLNTETKISVIDANRHYYPLVQGDKLKIIYEIKNAGDSPLNISDILPTCGCILVDESQTQNIPPGGAIFLKLTYNSNKNVGLVNHYIYLHGNYNKGKPLVLSFDVHVVPDAIYTKDYEEIHKTESEKNGDVEGMVDGNTNEKGYYIN
jgi:hypothetical protein